MEKEQIFASKVKYQGIFNFSDFYKFCYDYLTDELGFNTGETKYKEKIKGTEKELEIEWIGEVKIDDYFKHVVKITHMIKFLKQIEIEQDGKKKKTNSGEVETSIKGTLVRDYRGDYSTNPTRRWMRSIYEKWIINNRIEKMEDKLIEDCDDFLNQAKSFLDLEGKK